LNVKLLSEHGYEEAALGFSLSYNTSIERAKEILLKYAWSKPGESKFLESICLWLDVTAPRYWWQEADTYRVGSTKQSQSTMHTLMKAQLTENDFEDSIYTEYVGFDNYLKFLNGLLEHKDIPIDNIKSLLPEGFLQRRIWVINYKCLQNIYLQRKNHRLPQWHYFFDEIFKDLQHPEFIKPPEAK
jgi:hypothetical protein